MKKFIALAVLPFALAACDMGGAGKTNDYGTTNGMLTEEAIATTGESFASDEYLLAAGPKYLVGTPYMVDNVQYTPAEDYGYNQNGIAGIIPADLNGAPTTNGETFNSEQMLAASKVLPLPSVVKVTNLENGSSALLRVNNRGPFVNSRIMDVSAAAARKLGMTGQAKVQVQILSDQSIAMKNATLSKSGQNPVVDGAATAGQATNYSGTGPYTVQLAAFYNEDSATALANRMASMGDARVINEGGMYKVRLVGMDATTARRTIDKLRNQESMSPGLLENGRWVNADSI